MTIHLYTGGSRIVGKSGVGQAIAHQREMLRLAGLQTTSSFFSPSEAVQLNTVFPDSAAMAVLSRLMGKKVVYYGHSTMEDFRNSFKGSSWLAPLFKRWICFCYGLGDVVITPTEYSAAILKSYGIRRPIHAVSNGIDTHFFAPSEQLRQSFRARWNITSREKVVISVGHYIQRKGILDFLEVARRMPDVRFFWFGYTNLNLIPAHVRQAIVQAPPNVTFPGFVDREGLREAYCGADAFAFLSHEETEGIVVLEALACGTPILLRDIPVYEGWLQNGQDVYKGRDLDQFQTLLGGMLDGSLPCLSAAGRKVAEQRSYSAIGARLRSIYDPHPASSPLAKGVSFRYNGTNQRALEGAAHEVRVYQSRTGGQRPWDTGRPAGTAHGTAAGLSHAVQDPLSGRAAGPSGILPGSQKPGPFEAARH